MREQYIILRTEPTQLPHPGTGYRSRPARRESPLRLELAVGELDTKQVAELSNDPSAMTAPNMPVRLIAPCEVEPLADDVDAPVFVPWGLHTVGATESPFTGAGITVGILDTGIDSTHPTFSGVQLEERDFTGEGAWRLERSWHPLRRNVLRKAGRRHTHRGRTRNRACIRGQGLRLIGRGHSRRHHAGDCLVRRAWCFDHLDVTRLQLRRASGATPECRVPP